MSKKCARCEKAVYPAEELKCLDKSWHKACFKCTECGMALTMKNYKGFNKLPYCNAHYPQLSATVVADTPENRRLASASTLQSQAVYHQDYIQNIRGTVTSVAEDNEMKRAKQVGSVISNASYQQGRDAGDTNRGSMSSEPSYTRPMRSYNEEEGSYPQPTPMFGGHMPVPTSAPPPQNAAQRPSVVYTAMYDYDAQDDDEVSFQENDRIIDCEVIDEGWVVGTVQRTGMRGMIPANYIEQV